MTNPSPCTSQPRTEQSKQKKAHVPAKDLKWPMAVLGASTKRRENAYMYKTYGFVASVPAKAQLGAMAVLVAVARSTRAQACVCTHSTLHVVLHNALPDWVDKSLFLGQISAGLG